MTAIVRSRDRGISPTVWWASITVVIMVVGSVLSWMAFPHQGKATVTIDRPTDLVGISMDSDKKIDVPMDVYRHAVSPEEFASLNLPVRVATVWGWETHAYVTKYADAPPGGDFDSYMTTEPVYHEIGYGRSIEGVGVSADGKSIVVHTERSMDYGGGRVWSPYTRSMGTIFLVFVAVVVSLMVTIVTSNDNKRR